MPLGHHYYGWGNTTRGGSRRQYFDEYAWGGFNASPDLPWGQGGNRDLWIRREDTGPMDDPSTNFGSVFDPGHLLLLDLNVAAAYERYRKRLEGSKSEHSESEHED